MMMVAILLNYLNKQIVQRLPSSNELQRARSKTSITRSLILSEIKVADFLFIVKQGFLVQN